MLIEQLKADYRQIYRTLSDERGWRMKVFPPGHPLNKSKIVEIDEALAALVRIKELLKAHLLINPEQQEQLPLLAVPAERKEYQ